MVVLMMLMMRILLLLMVLLLLSLLLRRHRGNGDDSRIPGAGGSPRWCSWSAIIASWRCRTLAGVESLTEGGLVESAPPGIVARERVGLAMGGGGWGDAGVGSTILHHTPAHALTPATAVHALQQNENNINIMNRLMQI